MGVRDCNVGGAFYCFQSLSETQDISSRLKDSSLFFTSIIGIDTQLHIWLGATPEVLWSFQQTEDVDLDNRGICI